MGEEQEQSRSGVHRQDKAEGKASRQDGRACPLHSERQGESWQLHQRCGRPASWGVELMSRGDGSNKLVVVALENKGGCFFLTNPLWVFSQPCSISLRTKRDL